MLNNGTPNIAGFRIADGQLVELEGSARPLSAQDADPARVSFSRDGRILVVTERGTDCISTYAIDERGYAAAADDDQVVRARRRTGSASPPTAR